MERFELTPPNARIVRLCPILASYRGIFLSVALLSTANVGDGVAQAFASLLGTTVLEGGYLAGALFTAAIFLAFLIISSKLGGGATPSFGGLLMGAIVSFMLGWWPPVTIIITALLLAAVVVGPFKEGRSSEGV